MSASFIGRLRVVALSLALSALPISSIHAQGTEEKPAGAVSAGNTWCVIVSGKYAEFLAEVARLVDQGAEVQGGYQWEQGKFSALICKRGAGK